MGVYLSVGNDQWAERGGGGSGLVVVDELVELVLDALAELANGRGDLRRPLGELLLGARQRRRVDSSVLEPLDEGSILGLQFRQQRVAGRAVVEADDDSFVDDGDAAVALVSQWSERERGPVAPELRDTHRDQSEGSSGPT